MGTISIFRRADLRRPDGADSRRPTAGFHRPTGDSRRSTAGFHRPMGVGFHRLDGADSRRPMGVGFRRPMGVGFRRPMGVWRRLHFPRLFVSEVLVAIRPLPSFPQTLRGVFRVVRCVGP